MNESTHERTMMRYPSFSEMFGVLFTKMNGKIPTENVMMKLMIRAESALSLPFIMETIIDRNMKSALTSRAVPTFLDMTFRFIVPLAVCPSSYWDGVCLPKASLKPLRRRLSCLFSSTTSVMLPLSSCSSSSPSKLTEYVLPTVL